MNIVVLVKFVHALNRALVRGWLLLESWAPQITASFKVNGITIHSSVTDRNVSWFWLLWGCDAYYYYFFFPSWALILGQRCIRVYKVVVILVILSEQMLVISTSERPTILLRKTKRPSKIRLKLISKIQLLVYYKCCVLIGWASTRQYVIAP